MIEISEWGQFLLNFHCPVVSYTGWPKLMLSLRTPQGVLFRKFLGKILILFRYDWWVMRLWSTSTVCQATSLSAPWEWIRRDVWQAKPSLWTDHLRREVCQTSAETRRPTRRGNKSKKVLPRTKRGPFSPYPFWYFIPYYRKGNNNIMIIFFKKSFRPACSSDRNHVGRRRQGQTGGRGLSWFENRWSGVELDYQMDASGR